MSSITSVLGFQQRMLDDFFPLETWTPQVSLLQECIFSYSIVTWGWSTLRTWESREKCFSLNLESTALETRNASKCNDPVASSSSLTCLCFTLCVYIDPLESLCTLRCASIYSRKTRRCDFTQRSNRTMHFYFCCGFFYETLLTGLLEKVSWVKGQSFASCF